jgi:hypothetical protein
MNVWAILDAIPLKEIFTTFRDWKAKLQRVAKFNGWYF